LSRVRRLSWIPPFVVGLSAAVASEVAVGLLLYVTPGFLRALTLILAVLLGSFALGLWTAPHSDERLTERLRRRWLLVMFAFAGGSLVSGVWSVQGGLAGSATTQGVGLALLAALPLYSCGALLGGMSAPRLSHVRGPVGSSAAAGAALGTVLAGYVLAALLLPVSIYAFCLVLLSGAAVVHGWVISAEGERRSLHSASSPHGIVRVEEWSWGKSRREKVLTENGRVRGVEDAGGQPVRRWEVAALEVLTAVAREAPGRLPGPVTQPGESPSGSLQAELPEGDQPRPRPATLLILGAGTFTLSRLLLERVDELELEAVERNPAVVDAARAYFAAPEDGSRLRVRSGDPRVALMDGCTGAHQAIVLDSSAVAPEDPLPVTSAGELLALRRCLVEGGVLLLGGIDRSRARGAPLERLLSEAREAFPSAAVFRSEPDRRAPVVSNALVNEMMVLLSTDPDARFPSTVAGLALEMVREPPQPPAANAGVLP
jgi:MFS family permease